MKMKTLMAATVASFLATSFAYAAPMAKLVDDVTNSTTMQQMSSDDANAVAAGPMADAGKNVGANVGAIPPSSAQPAAPDNSMAPSANNIDPQSMAMNNSNNMDPQTAAPSTADGDVSADTTTGDDDY